MSIRIQVSGIWNFYHLAPQKLIADVGVAAGVSFYCHQVSEAFDDNVGFGYIFRRGRHLLLIR